MSDSSPSTGAAAGTGRDVDAAEPMGAGAGEQPVEAAGRLGQNPKDTDHPTGVAQAEANADAEPPG